MVKTTLGDVKSLLEQYEQDMLNLRAEARLEGFREGLKKAREVKVPTQAQFNRDHKEPVYYGEDMAGVVATSSRKKAAKMLECDTEAIEEIPVYWGVYEEDGEMIVNYYVSTRLDEPTEDVFYALGLWY